MIPRVMFVLDSTRVCVAALMLSAFGGCAQSEFKPVETSGRPGVTGPQSGIELRWWRVDDAHNVLGRTLAKYADRPVPMHDSVRTLWRQNGLRVLSVPVSELSQMRADVWRAGRAQRNDGDSQSGLDFQYPSQTDGLTRVHEEWLGERPRWTEIATGIDMPRGAVIALDSGRVRLGPGRARMLARCWSIPLTGLSSRVPAGLRLELALQWADLEIRDRNRPTLDEPTIARAAEDEGMVFTRFVAEMIAIDGEAIVIVTDAPDADWDAEPDNNTNPTRLPAASVPTLGRALLSEPGAGEYSSSVKVVVILTPEIPEHYELIQR